MTLLLFSVLVFFLLGLLSTAYLTLHERHMLAMSQHRLGPSKTGFLGLLQPFSDALKLLQKEIVYPSTSIDFYYFIAPLFMFLIWFLYWAVSLPSYPLLSMGNSGLFFLCLVGSSVYSLFLCGITSNSKYSYLGALRATAQSLTFEVSFFFLVVSYLMIVEDLCLSPSSTLFHMPMAYLWLIHLVVELGRAPVDFSEGESEVVSGYNLEYGGLYFIFIFLSEYGFLLFFSSIFSQVFLPWGGYVAFYMVSTFIIMLRSALPRYRYDHLIGYFWKLLLPISIQSVVLYFILVKVILEV